MFKSFVAALVLLVAIALASITAGVILNTPLNVGVSELEIKNGEGLNSVLERFRNTLPSPLLLKLYATVSGKTALIQGVYRIEPHYTSLDILHKFTSGEQNQYRVTVPEGSTARVFLQLLYDSPHIKLLTREWSDDKIAQTLGLSHIEGWLEPNTYFYTHNTTDLDILRLALVQQRTVLAQLWDQRQPDLPLKNQYEALILASIVEKESSVLDEKPRIAGVFIRRLQRGMRLQSDPTVVYGLGDAYDNNITARHLKQRTPYNTYVINGLPPTPIALPGQDTIAAILNPEMGTDLYFVAVGDGSGRHKFSATYKEHMVAVRAMLKFQKSRRRN